MGDGIPRIDYAEDEDASKQTVLRDLLTFRPIQRRRACLVVVGGNRSVGRIFRLVDGEMTIGRAVACDIVLEEEGVSRHHATVRVDGTGDVVIMDVGSANGLIHAGARVKKQLLRDGDRIEIGDAGVALLHMDDIDETVRQNLLHSATIDDETKLPTRRYFREMLERELALASRYGMPVSILLCSIDSFKGLVDSAGRGIAISALRKASRVAQDLFAREEVFFGRFGEDQFVLALPETANDDVRVGGAMLCKAIESSTLSPVQTPSARATVSVGLATSQPGTTADDLLDLAEKSLYRAKIAGGNQVGAER